MSLKLNNQLAHLPNEISISRYEKHQRCLVLSFTFPITSEDEYIPKGVIYGKLSAETMES